MALRITSGGLKSSDEKPTGLKIVSGGLKTAAPDTSFDTKLDPQDELKFQAWKNVNAPKDSGADYDLRGAFKAGLSPSQNGHWPDTYKKPNHPTFSNESIYATGANAAKAGKWEGEKYIPPQGKLTILSGGPKQAPAPSLTIDPAPKELQPFNGKVGTRDFNSPILEMGTNPAALGQRLAEKFTGRAMPKTQNDPGQLFDAALGAVRGATSAKKPVLTKTGDLDILKTLGLSAFEGIIHPEAIPSFGAQIQESLPATHPIVSGLAGTALDLGLLHNFGKVLPTEGKSIEQMVTDELKGFFGEQKAAKIEQIRKNSKGLDIQKEINAVVMEVKAKNPTVSESEIGALKSNLAGQIGRLKNDVSRGEVSSVAERVFKPGGLKEFVLGDNAQAGEVAGLLKKSELAPEGIPQEIWNDLTTKEKGDYFKSQVSEPTSAKGLGLEEGQAGRQPQKLSGLERIKAIIGKRGTIQQKLGLGPKPATAGAKPPYRLTDAEAAQIFGQEPAKPSGEPVRITPGGGLFRGKAVNPTAPGVSFPSAGQLVPFQPPAPPQPFKPQNQGLPGKPVITGQEASLPPKFTGKAPKQATKPTGRTLLGYIRTKYGGIDPKSITDYNVKEDFKQHGLLGVLSGKGAPFTRVAMAMASDGLIPGWQEGMSESEALMSALKSKNRQMGGEKANENVDLASMENKIAADAMLPYEQLIGDLVSRGYTADDIRKAIERNQPPEPGSDIEEPAAPPAKKGQIVLVDGMTDAMKKNAPSIEVDSSRPAASLTPHEQSMANITEAAKKKLGSALAKGEVAPASKFTGRIPGTEAKFPAQPIRPQDKNLIQETKKPDELFQEKKVKKDIETKAEKIYGTTSSFVEAGYLTQDGKLLDFSGRKDGYVGKPMRNTDHREIHKAYPEGSFPEDNSGTAYMIDFMNRGNIRLQENGADVSIETPLTDTQKNVLAKQISQVKGEYFLDVSDAKGYTIVSKEFKTGTRPSQILAFIEDVFSKREFFQEKQNTFFSQLERTIQEKIPNQASPEQILNTLKNAGVKQDEMDWLDVEGFLAGKEKVTKTELLDYIRANNVQVEEVVKGGGQGNEEAQQSDVIYRAKQLAEEKGSTWKSMTPSQQQVLIDKARAEFKETKFSNYQLPGGENYREFNFRLTGPKIEPYKDSHWDEPVDIWVRANERTDSEGKRVFLIEEVQSGRHQKGRKEGYASGIDSAEFEAKINEVSRAMYAAPARSEERRNLGEELERLKREANSLKVPNAPFKKTWHELAMKRMLRYAAENGYDKIAWTTGEQQAERYDLSKQVASINYQKRSDGTFNVTAYPNEGGEISLGSAIQASELEGKVGKDVAQKIISGATDSWKTLEGADLKVGGEGMKGFYDQIIPSFLNKYTKKWGGRVSRTELVTNTDLLSSKEIMDGEGDNLGYNVHSLEITPTMEASVMQGQPLFNQYQEGDSTFEAEKSKAQAILERNNIKDIMIALVDEIIMPGGKRAAGSLTPAKKLIKLVAKPEKTTGSHEAGHAILRDLGLDSPLVKEAFQEKGAAEYSLDVEEKLMDQFAEYAEKRRKGEEAKGFGPKVKRLFEAIWNWILEKLGKKDVAEALFKRMYEGPAKEAPKKFSGRLNLEPGSLFQEKQNKFGFEPDEPSKLAGKLSRRTGYNLEQSEKIIELAKQKGLILPGKELRSRLFGLLRHYEGATFDQLKEYVSQLQGNPENPAVIFKLHGDIQKDAEVMKLIHQVSDQWEDINKLEMNTLDAVRIMEKVTQQNLWEDNILADNTFQVIAGADSAMFDRLQKEINELDKAREGIRKNSKEDADLMRKYENAITEEGVTFTDKEKRVLAYLRKKLDSLILEANQMREVLGKNKIPYRQNYLPHLSEQNVLMDFMKENRGEQIPDITNEQWNAIRKGDFTKGNMPFNKFALKRRGMFSEKLAAIGNYEYYLKTILKEIYMGPAITHARKFVEYAVLKQPNAYKALDRWLNDVKGKTSILDQDVAGLIAGHPLTKKMRSLLAKSALFGNINFYAMNASNFAISYDELGNYLNKGLIKFATDKTFRDFAFKNSMMLKGRSVDPDIDPSALKSLEELLNKMTVILEYNNVGSTWAGAYIKATEQLGFGKAKAIKYADAIARRTQVGYKPYEVNAIMRSNKGKILQQFQTWSYNAMNHILYDLKIANLPKLGRKPEANRFTGKMPKAKKVEWAAFFGLMVTAIILNSLYKSLGLRAPYGPNAAIPSFPDLPKFGKGKYEQPPLYQLAADAATVFTGKKPETRQKAAMRAGLSVIPAGRQLFRFSQGQVFPKANPNPDPYATHGGSNNPTKDKFTGFSSKKFKKFSGKF